MPKKNPDRIYQIVRAWYDDRGTQVMKTHLTLEEAQTHCRRSDTHGEVAGVRWFDGCDYMPGCKPKE